MPTHDLPEERRQLIINILDKDGKVTVPGLSNNLGVSVDTIRRDLKELESTGHLSKVHGGALPRSPSTAAHAVRRKQNIQAKEALAREAAKLIEQDQVILFDSGTTNLEIARTSASSGLRATVITTSPPIAIALAVNPSIQVIMLPGILNKGSMAVAGSSTLESLQHIRADICICGACSIHKERGITANLYEEAAIKRLMVQNSNTVIVAVTADKLGTAAPFAVANIDRISHLVTESSVALDTLTPYQTAGAAVIRAGI